MKNIPKIILSLLLAVLFFGSCKEDKLMMHDGSSNIYFRHKKWTASAGAQGIYTTTINYNGAAYTVTTPGVTMEARDSMEFSFARIDKTIESAITFMPVTVVGEVANVDRKFSYKVLETSTAVKGEDYEILDAFIPANKIHGGIVVEIFKKNVKSEGAYRYLDVELIPNENFTVQYDSITRSAVKTTEKVSTLTFRLSLNSSLTAPQYWSAYEIGYFSTKKALKFMEVVNMSMEDFYGMPSLDLRIIRAQMFKSWLIQMAKDGDPVYEDDGVTLMTTDEIRPAPPTPQP